MRFTPHMVNEELVGLLHSGMTYDMREENIGWTMRSDMRVIQYSTLYILVSERRSGLARALPTSSGRATTTMADMMLDRADMLVEVCVDIGLPENLACCMKVLDRRSIKVQEVEASRIVLSWPRMLQTDRMEHAPRDGI